MNKIYLDFETYSECSLPEKGLYNYIEHPSTKPLSMAYKIDEGPVTLWTLGDSFEHHLLLIDAIKNGGLFYAMNATFDYEIWNKVAHKFDPVLFLKFPVTQVRDVKALCARNRLPQNLKNAAIALKCKTEKMEVGKKLIRLCCTSGFFPTAEDYANLYQYNIVDVEVLYEVVQSLPADHLTEPEQKMWELTYHMNKKGLPIDLEAVESIIKYLANYMESMNEVLPLITDGKITKPTQTQRIKKFCNDNGIDMPNTTAETVNDYLKKKDLPENVRTVLEIRQLTGLSSLKKYITLKNLYNNGVVQDIYNYHGAGTGRWAGKGFQIHNLPREKKNNPDIWVERFKDQGVMKRPALAAKALIRSMIYAPEGCQFIVSDFSSIEDRVLMWLNEEDKVLDLMRKGECAYKDMASFIYNVPISEVTKEQRFDGKQTRLGCGYQMGAPRFKANLKEKADKVISLTRAKELVTAYRYKHPKVVKGWTLGNEAAKAAVRHPGKTFKALKCLFRTVKDRKGRKWLRITLPSGRSLMYVDPVIENDKYGSIVKYSGLNAKTFQFTRLPLKPGLITENITQAVARDLLVEAKFNVMEKLPFIDLRISIHDELGGLVADKDITPGLLDLYNESLCPHVPWAEGLPIKAEGYIARRFRKD